MFRQILKLSLVLSICHFWMVFQPILQFGNFLAIFERFSNFPKKNRSLFIVYGPIKLNLVFWAVHMYHTCTCHDFCGNIPIKNQDNHFSTSRPMSLIPIFPYHVPFYGPYLYIHIPILYIIFLFSLTMCHAPPSFSTWSRL